MKTRIALIFVSMLLVCSLATNVMLIMKLNPKSSFEGKWKMGNYYLQINKDNTVVRYLKHPKTGYIGETEKGYIENGKIIFKEIYKNPEVNLSGDGESKTQHNFTEDEIDKLPFEIKSSPTVRNIELVSKDTLAIEVVTKDNTYNENYSKIE